MPKERSVVGDLINFRGLVYSPVNEQGVVYLFSKVAEDLNMYVEEVRTEFPDCVARRFNGRGWEKVYIEFEFRSSCFQQHGHDPQECDMIVRWEHDWPGCPLEVLELKSVIAGLPNRKIERPVVEPRSVDDIFQRLGASVALRVLYGRLERELLALGEGIWRKVSQANITFYSPNRVFVYVRPQKASLRLTLSTRGQPIADVEPVGYQCGGFKWGRVWVSREDQLPGVISACRESYRRILEAVEANEATGWYAAVEEADGDSAEGGEGER